MPSVFGRDRICAIVAARNARAALGQLRLALGRTRLIELRLDWLHTRAEILALLRSLRKLQQILRRKQATLIATCRRRAAGGRFTGSVPEELARLRLAAACGCAWADVEVETAEKLVPGRLKKLIAPARCLVSCHTFWGMPRDLRAVLRRLGSADASKVAAKADSLAEALRLLRVAADYRNVVAVPMGEVATPARILALREGSALAYAPVEKSTAAGQVSLDEMRELYRADCLNRRTRVYGVVGNPVRHSLSPQLHNAAFQARRVNAVYLPFLVRDLRDFLAAVKPLGVGGFSVTLPYKERIIRYLDGCDALAARIGAVNTVVVRGGGKLYGYNTDYVGVLRALERKIPLSASRVLVFGAGGAARGVAFALAQAGSAVGVCARRASRAKALARAVGGEMVPRFKLRGEFFDAVVNATPVGMYPDSARSPLDSAELNCRLVFDLVYRPPDTRLLQLARRRGIESVSGVEMFLAQGMAQWEIWMGERAPAAAMRRAVLAVLRREERRQERA